MSDSGKSYDQLVKRLLVNGSIKLIAVDFDMTLVSVHTGGNWMFTARPLATRIRPGFIEFIREAQRHGLFVAIVTFSPQVDLVRNVLKEVFTEKEVERICIRGNTNDWKPHPRCRKEGNQMKFVIKTLLEL